MSRTARYALVVAAVVAVLVLLLLVVVTRTEYGSERAGRVVLSQIRGAVLGEIEVERITSGRLLSGVTLHGFTIRGPDGRLFLAADSARLAYRFRTFLSGALVFDRLILHSPDVVIERLPGDTEWNYQKIFPGDTTAADTGGTRVILIEDATVHDGLARIRMPWEPDLPIQPSDTARLLLKAVPGGTARVWRFEAIEGRLPRIVWESPGERTRLIEIGALSARAYIWETPLHIEELRGVLTLRDSLVAFQAPHVRLPRSEASAVGKIIMGENNQYDIQIDSRDMALADLRWVYPEMPDDGAGSMQLRIQSQGPGSILWLVRDARVRTSGSELAGSFGMVTGDTTYFTNVDLDTTPVDVEVLLRLLPIDFPLEGLTAGTVEIDGT